MPEPESREDAWSDLIAATPPGWYVGRSGYQDARRQWMLYAYDPTERAVAVVGAGVGASDFSRNLVRFRAEGRWGLAVTRPSGFVKITIA